MPPSVKVQTGAFLISGRTAAPCISPHIPSRDPCMTCATRKWLHSYRAMPRINLALCGDIPSPFEGGRLGQGVHRVAQETRRRSSQGSPPRPSLRPQARHQRQLLKDTATGGASSQPPDDEPPEAGAGYQCGCQSRAILSVSRSCLSPFGSITNTSSLPFTSDTKTKRLSLDQTRLLSSAWLNESR